MAFQIGRFGGIDEDGNVVLEETMVNKFTEIWDGDSNSP